MCTITDDFAAELRRALMIGPGETPPDSFIREEGWQCLLLHRAQRRVQIACTRLATPDDAA